MAAEDTRRCPDDGVCHHSCLADECFRVRACAPLSDYGEDWKPEDVERFGGPSKQTTIEDVLVGGAVDDDVFLVRARAPSAFIHTSTCRHAYDPVQMRWRWADENPTIDWLTTAPWLKACKRCNPPSPFRPAEAEA